MNFWKISVSINGPKITATRKRSSFDSCNFKISSGITGISPKRYLLINTDPKKITMTLRAININILTLLKISVILNIPIKSSDT
jgi:hypothetical protein